MASISGSFRLKEFICSVRSGRLKFINRHYLSTYQSNMKKSLALIMGASPEHFTEEDMKNSLEYLFPIGITDRKACPAESSSFSHKEKQDLDSKYRPQNSNFYTGASSYYDLKFKLYCILYDNNRDRCHNISSSYIKSIEKSAFERVIGENITEKMFEEFLTVLKDVTRHDMNFSDYCYVTNFLKKFYKRSLFGHLACNRQTIPIAYGFRKTASAKVEVYPGEGSVVINSKSLLEYFPRLEDRQQVLYPFTLTHSMGRFDVIANVAGGGSTGQAGAIRHGISKAISFYPEIPFDMLVKNCLMMRDSRLVERKKPGQKKARKKFAWVKR